MDERRIGGGICDDRRYGGRKKEGVEVVYLSSPSFSPSSTATPSSSLLENILVLAEFE